MNLTGWRTYIVMAISGFLVPVLAKHGFNLDVDQQAWIVGVVMAVIAFVMRTVTKTPPGSALPAPTVLPPPAKP
jgi:hypothetical protein